MARKISVWEQEGCKLAAVACVLVLLQIIFNTFGVGGMTIVISMYVIAILSTNLFVFDINGIRWEKRLQASDYMVRCGVDCIVILVGFLVWFIVGILYGVDTTVHTFKKPEDALQQFSGSAFILKVLYSLASHLTLFSACQIFVNLYNAAYVFFN